VLCNENDKKGEKLRFHGQTQIHLEPDRKMKNSVLNGFFAGEDAETGMLRPLYNSVLTTNDRNLKFFIKPECLKQNSESVTARRKDRQVKQCSLT
jgi:hypothetical protein